MTEVIQGSPDPESARNESEYFACVFVVGVNHVAFDDSA
jgi:hypothetical protein